MPRVGFTKRALETFGMTSRTTVTGHQQDIEAARRICCGYGMNMSGFLHASGVLRRQRAIRGFDWPCRSDPEPMDRSHIRHIAALGTAAILAATVPASSLAQSASSTPTVQHGGGPLPSIDALKREYVRCERISSQRRLSMHGMAFCGAVSDQLLKREFGGDLDLLLVWWQGERQASAAGIGP